MLIFKKKKTQFFLNFFDQKFLPVNPIERPKLRKKRKRNSSFSVERIPKRKRKSINLNPHHAQLETDISK